MAIQGFVSGYSLGIPNADQVIAGMVACLPAVIRHVQCEAESGGSGSTAIVDLRINGVSCYADPSHRPQLAPGASGRFTSYPPDRSAVRIGDRITLVAVSSGNKSQIIATAALEEP